MNTINSSVYKVRAGSFEGPLELLLSLIEARKLFVNEFSLSEVTNDYIQYIKELGEVPTEKRIADISYFIMIAATLILIKSKSLLPNLNLTEEETEKIDDLEIRLKLYQIIKNASIDIKNQFGTQIIFSAPERNWNIPVFSPDVRINQELIGLSILDVIQGLPKKTEKLPEIEVKRVVSIDEMINDLTERIQNSMNMSFREFAKGNSDMNEKEIKVTVIVSFLAMLELVREGIIDVIQNSSFEDINISKVSQPETLN